MHAAFISYAIDHNLKTSTLEVANWLPKSEQLGADPGFVLNHTTTRKEIFGAIKWWKWKPEMESSQAHLPSSFNTPTPLQMQY